MKVRLKILLDEPRGSAWRSSARGVNCPVKSGKYVSDMSRKLKLNPKISYMLGLYSHCNQEKSAIGITVDNSRTIEKFVEISLKEFNVQPNRILISEEGRNTKALFYNSKLRNLFDKTIARKSKLFKYKNAYAMEYIAGVFDACGKVDNRGIFMEGIDREDQMILENLGIHILQKGKRNYIINDSFFIMFIKEFSMRLSYIAHIPGNERDPH